MPLELTLHTIICNHVYRNMVEGIHMQSFFPINDVDSDIVEYCKCVGKDQANNLNEDIKCENIMVQL